MIRRAKTKAVTRVEGTPLGGNGAHQVPFGEYLRAARKRQGLTIEAFAMRGHFSTNTILKWEIKGGLPDPGNIPRLAAALDMPEEELAGIVEAARAKKSDNGAPVSSDGPERSGAVDQIKPGPNGNGAPSTTGGRRGAPVKAESAPDEQEAVLRITGHPVRGFRIQVRVRADWLDQFVDTNYSLMDQPLGKGWGAPDPDALGFRILAADGVPAAEKENRVATIKQEMEKARKALQEPSVEETVVI